MGTVAAGRAPSAGRRPQGGARNPRRGKPVRVDHAEVLAAYDQQVRRSTEPDGTGAVYQADELVVRRIAPPGTGGSSVLWSALSAGTAGSAIAEQVALFSSRGEEFEWKLHSYDAPADLADRLLAAGLVPQEPESLMIGEVEQVCQTLRSAGLPPGVRLEQRADPAVVDLLADAHEAVFGTDESELRAALKAQLAVAPDSVGLAVAMAGQRPVCAGRIEFIHGSEFAGLWGGGTVPDWRGRGIYRALVRCRAELAARRGYRYLTVDASDQSRPILERAGFERVAVTTPYLWSP